MITYKSTTHKLVLGRFQPNCTWSFLKWIFIPTFTGYGASSGKPTEKNLYADIEASWHCLRTRFGISPENIILYGQSIGTVPTVDLASKYEVGAVILHSPLMSGMRVAFPNTRRTWFFDAFPRYVFDNFLLFFTLNFAKVRLEIFSLINI